MEIFNQSSKRPLIEFSNLAEARAVLGHHRIEDRIRALQDLLRSQSIDIGRFAQQAIADLICASRERTSRTLARLRREEAEEG